MTSDPLPPSRTEIFLFFYFLVKGMTILCLFVFIYKKLHSVLNTRVLESTLENHGPYVVSVSRSLHLKTVTTDDSNLYVSDITTDFTVMLVMLQCVLGIMVWCVRCYVL